MYGLRYLSAAEKGARIFSNHKKQYVSNSLTFRIILIQYHYFNSVRLFVKFRSVFWSVNISYLNDRFVKDVNFFNDFCSGVQYTITNIMHFFLNVYFIFFQSLQSSLSRYKLCVCIQEVDKTCKKETKCKLDQEIGWVLGQPIMIFILTKNAYVNYSQLHVQGYDFTNCVVNSIQLLQLSFDMPIKYITYLL